MRPKSILGIVKTYFPRVSDSVAEGILWEHTGYPAFWNIPEDGNTPEQCLRKQLREFRKYGRACIRCGKHRVPLRYAMCEPCGVLWEAESAASESAAEP